MLIVHKTHPRTMESQSAEPTLFWPLVLLGEDKLQHKITAQGLGQLWSSSLQRRQRHNSSGLSQCLTTLKVNRGYPHIGLDFLLADL